MKYLPLLLLVFVGCFEDLPPPKFYKGQKVTYKVPSFYSHVCSGKGEIYNYTKGYDSYEYYLLIPQKDYGCIVYWFQEADLKAVK